MEADFEVVAAGLVRGLVGMVWGGGGCGRGERGAGTGVIVALRGGEGPIEAGAEMEGAVVLNRARTRRVYLTP